MLKPRIPTSPPPPQSSVRIGAYVVDLTAREIIEETSGARTRITSKAQAVIAELAVNPGQVLSRDELMDRVWTGAFPTGDVLTQAITSLRKAFGDHAEAPRYIETISKSGYRLIAPVQWLSAESRNPRPAGLSESGLSPPAPPTPTPSRHVMRWAPTIGLTLILAAIAGFWFRKSPPPPPGAIAASPPTPLVIVAGAGDEWGPRFSPDASAIVFVASATPSAPLQLFVQSAMVAPATALTQPGEGERDLAPAWSPDGRSIAFQRHSDGAACKLMLVTATGGTPRQIGLCPSNTILVHDWSPDGSHLVMGGKYDEKSGAFPIQKFDLASGTWSTLDYPRAPGNLDLEPRYSPDGRWLVFRRNLSAADLWRMPSGGGKLERLTEVNSDIRGFDWAPDGRHIVFSSINEAGLALFSLALASRQVTPLGIADATFPDFPRHGNDLVFELQRGQLGLGSVDLNAPDAPAARILASSGNELNAAGSPDHHSIAFYSDRSGKASVWVAPLGTQPGAAQQVAGLVPVARFNPAWSPDSRRFLVIGMGEQGAGLYEIDRDSLRPQWLSTPFGAARFADYLDDRRLIVGSIVEEEQSMWVTERDGNQLRPIRPKLGGVTYARADRSRDRILLVRTGQWGLWSTDSRLTTPERVLKSMPNIAGYKLWTFVDDQLMIARMDGDTRQYEIIGWPLDELEGEPHYRRMLGDVDVLTVGTLTPGHLVFTEAYGNGRDIGMIRFSPQTAER